MNSSAKLQMNQTWSIPTVLTDCRRCGRLGTERIRQVSSPSHHRSPLAWKMTGRSPIMTRMPGDGNDEIEYVRVRRALADDYMDGIIDAGQYSRALRMLGSARGGRSGRKDVLDGRRGPRAGRLAIRR